MPKDEEYIVDLCDKVLGSIGCRQFNGFDFLVGDPGRDGRCRRLPVDAYYRDRNLVIEYRERQHSEAIPIMDLRQTVSGCSRGEQRKRYDKLRREILQKHGMRLIELDYSMFPHDLRKRLCRDAAADEAVIRSELRQFLTS